MVYTLIVLRYLNFKLIQKLSEWRFKSTILAFRSACNFVTSQGAVVYGSSRRRPETSITYGCAILAVVGGTAEQAGRWINKNGLIAPHPLAVASLDFVSHRLQRGANQVEQLRFE